MVKLLLAQKADDKIREGNYGSALQAACVLGNEYIVKMFVKQGGDVYATGGLYSTALQAAAINRWWSSAEYLMKKLRINNTSLGKRSKEKKAKIMSRAENTPKTATEMMDEPNDILEEVAAVEREVVKRKPLVTWL